VQVQRAHSCEVELFCLGDRTGGCSEPVVDVAGDEVDGVLFDVDPLVGSVVVDRQVPGERVDVGRWREEVAFRVGDAISELVPVGCVGVRVAVGRVRVGSGVCRSGDVIGPDGPVVEVSVRCGVLAEAQEVVAVEGVDDVVDGEGGHCR